MNRLALTAALLTLAAKGAVSRESVAPSHAFVHELPFDSDRKRMMVITRDQRGRDIAHVKGSVDVLLPLCVKFAADSGVRALSDADREAILAEIDDWLAGQPVDLAAALFAPRLPGPGT